MSLTEKERLSGRCFYLFKKSEHKGKNTFSHGLLGERSKTSRPIFSQEENIMAYRVKTYSLREEAAESGTRYFISFKDGQGDYHELEVSEQFFIEFRQMERRNRNLLQWDERHREFSEVWDETLNRRALRLPKSIEELIIEQERSELFYRTIAALPEIQRWRFLLYYEYDYNYYEIAAMEHCTASSVGQSIIRAKEKIKAQMKKYLCP